MRHAVAPLLGAAPAAPARPDVAMRAADEATPRSSARRGSQHEPKCHDGPSTPPQGAGTLPTPPTSHIDVSASRAPPAGSAAAPVPTNAEAGPSDSEPEHIDGSPSFAVISRRTKRLSGRGAAAHQSLHAVVGSSPPPVEEDTPRRQPASVKTERELTLQENDRRARASRGRGRTADARHGVWSEAADLDSDDSRDGDASDSRSSRSRTPSPMFGASEGHLTSVGALGPSAEEISALLFAESDEEERPSALSKSNVEQMAARLDALGLDAPSAAERELADMARSLVRHAQQQEQHITNLHDTLHRVRLRAVSALTSQRTTSHASLTAAQLSAARQAVELEGLRSQARMLGLKLARAEARADEVEHARARSVDEELRWADTMRNHTGAWAQQQAARAQAAMGPRNASAQKTPTSAPIGTTEASPGALAAAFELGEGRSSLAAAEPAGATGSNMDDVNESAPAGLGIRDSGMPAIEAQATVHDPIEATLSPLSSIVRERNKLLSDKRHLKSRVREVEAQREVLEKELRALRPLLISGGTKVVSTDAADESGVHSTPGRVKRSTSRRRRGPTMGDAEAEHLLLAARRMREVRRGDGHTSTAGSPQKRSAHAAEQARFEDRHALDEGRPRTPPPGMVPRTPQTPRTPRHVNGAGSVRQTPRSIGRSTGGLLDATMESAGARPFAGPRWAGPHERNESAMSSASFANSTGIDDLLHAAQSVFTPGERGPGGSSRPDGTQVSVGPSSAPYFPRMPPSSPLAVHEQLAPQDAFESPKRRRLSDAMPERQRMGVSLSPDKRAGATFGGRRVRTSTEGADPSTSALSALDLLADQAAASQVPSQSSDRSQHSDGAGAISDEGMVVEDPRWPARPANDAYHLGDRVRGARFGGPPPFPGPLLQHPPGYGYSVPPPGPGPQPWLASPAGGDPRVLEYTPMPYPPRPVTPPPQARHVPSEAPYSRDDGGVNPVQKVQSSPAKSKGGNTSPDKRLPYIRWSEEEDRKLRRAISEHGQRWEAVANDVGTRSYHQCRQRALLMRRKTQAASNNAAAGQ